MEVDPIEKINNMLNKLKILSNFLFEISKLLVVAEG